MEQEKTTPNPHAHIHTAGPGHTHDVAHAEHSTTATTHHSMHSQSAHSTASTTAANASIPTSRAWIIGLVIVLLVASLGFLLYQKITNTQPTPIPTNGNVQIKLLVDTQCKFCEQSNSILLKFDESNVKYDVQKIDAYSDEGKLLEQQFDVNFVPTALISITGLDQNAEIQYAMQALNRTRQGYVVFPEAFLDNKPRTLTYLNNDSSCSVAPGKIRVDAFVDFACKPCAEAYFILKSLQGTYDQLQVEYTPIQYRRFTQQGIDIALNNNRGAICAQDEGYFNDYIDCAFLNIQVNGTQDLNAMKSCIYEAGAKSKAAQQEFVACVQDTNKTIQNKLLDNIRRSVDLRAPAQFTPAFVFDCKYSFVGHLDLPLFLCQTHPELQGCVSVLAAGSINDQNITKEPKLNIYVPDHNVKVVNGGLDVNQAK